MLARIQLLGILTLGSLGAADCYLFTSFRGNGESGVYLATSCEGYRWEALNNNQPWLKPQHKGMLMRDPFLTRGPDGVYHLLWTWGWYRDAEGLRIGHATSRDLRQWSDQTAIPILPAEPAARNAWAPEMYWDKKNRSWLIYWATTIPGKFTESESGGERGLNHRMYATSTRDFREFTAARVFFDPGFSVIDTNIIEVDGKFVMIVKDERRNPLQKNLRLAFANEVAGPYAGLTEPFTKSWVEGPSAIRIGKDYLVYVDHYQKPQHYGAFRSRDLKQWEDVTDKMSFPPDHRHGTVMKIPEGLAKELTK